MAAIATACLIVALVAWSAVLASRGFARGGGRVLHRAGLGPTPVDDWSIPYKIESTATPPAVTRLRPISARMAAVRALCLAAYVERAQWERPQAAELLASLADPTSPLEEPRPAVPQGPDPTALNAWVREEGLWPLLGEIERRGLEAPAGQWDDTLRLYAEGAREALAMLAWAGHFSEDLPTFETGADSATLCASVGLMRPTAALLPDLALRAECELAAARELCQAWVWRARIALDQLDAEGSPAPQEVIRSAARYWSAGGAFQMVDEDFPVGDKPFTQLDAAACRRLHRIAQLRLHGLNWVCGLTHTWDHTASRRLSM